MARDPIQPAASKGRRVIARNRPKITAPAMIMKTMQEIRTVSPTAARNPFRESFRRARQMASPSVQLTAAASVAVTTPVKRAYMMTANRTMMSSASGRAWKRSFQVLLSAAGPQSGWRRQIAQTVAAMSTVAMALGMMFPKKSFPIDCPV